MRVIACPAAWKCPFNVSTTGRRRNSSSVLVAGREGERRLWEDLFVNTSDWWDNRLEKRSIRHPDFRHKIIREPLWLNSPSKPTWVDARLPVLHNHHAPQHPDSVFLQLEGLCKQGEIDKALDILLHMRDCSPALHSIYWSLVKACNEKKSLVHAKQVYHHITSLGLQAFSLIAEYLVSTLAKCGDAEAAVRAFHTLPYRSSFSWTALISMYLDQGDPEVALDMYQFMLDERVHPNERTFVAVLQACGSTLDLDLGRSIHKDCQRAGLATNAFVGCTLVSMYGKCGSITEALNVFDGMSNHSVVTWTAMLSAFLEQGEDGAALQFYRLMQEEGVNPNDRTIVVALQACGELAKKEGSVSGELRSTRAKSLEIGQALHSDARRRGFHLDVFVGSTLVSMYGKCGKIGEAESVFSGMDQRNIVSWNAMLSAYVECGLEKKALQLYTCLQEQNFTLNMRTYAIVIQASCLLAEKEEVIVVNKQPLKSMSSDIIRALHADARKKRFDVDVFVANALVCAYGKCGNVIEAENVFSGLQDCDVVSWTGLLFVYVEQGEVNKALEVYMQMQEKGMALDDVTLVCALQVCIDSGNVVVCNQIHFTIFSTRYGLSAPLALNLIHAYGSCTSIANAQAVFDGLYHHNVVLWTALMDGYAREGSYGKSLHKFEEMKLADIHPDGVTFLLALSACGHTGLVDKGVEYFESMCRDHEVIPEIKHYVSVADLLGRVGDFSKLKGLLLRMAVEPNMALWLCLLDACRTYGNIEVAKWAFDQAMQLNPEEAAAYALMSKIYANAGLWDSVSHLEDLRHDVGKGQLLNRPEPSGVGGQSLPEFKVRRVAGEIQCTMCLSQWPVNENSDQSTS